jgi:hypothetical protein
LLQKAIRRGETALAEKAAALLYRYRGKAIWRRLTTIAVEDVGIADLEALWEVVRLSADEELRAVLGSEAELIARVVDRLADAPKDRSADYLYCAVTKLETALAERTQMCGYDDVDLLSIAAKEHEPLIRRANAAFLLCLRGQGDAARLQEPAVQRLVTACGCPEPLEYAMIELTRSRAHPFALMLPLIWSRWNFSEAQRTVFLDALPAPEFVDEVPLYTYDFHTAAGKRAILSFARTNEEVDRLLSNFVPRSRWDGVAFIAAFYADAAPVSKRLEWSAGRLLYSTGLYADMMDAGSPFEAVLPLADAARRNVQHLNELRRACLVPSATSIQCN